MPVPVYADVPLVVPVVVVVVVVVVLDEDEPPPRFQCACEIAPK